MEPVNEMHAAIITYFSAERRESLLFLMAGAAAVGASAYLWITGSPHRAMAWPLTGIALIQVAVGWTVYARTDRQVKDLHTLLAKDRAAYAAAEIQRMETVRKSFRVYKAIEIVLLAAGLLGIFVYQDRVSFHAVAAGLVLQAGLMLVFDLYAESRAEVYVEKIRRLVG